MKKFEYKLVPYGEEFAIKRRRVYPWPIPNGPWRYQKYSFSTHRDPWDWSPNDEHARWLDLKDAQRTIRRLMQEVRDEESVEANYKRYLAEIKNRQKALRSWR